MAIDFPSSPTNGQIYANYIYDSSITAWRNVNTDTGIGTLNAMGLKNVVPTSVAVGSGSATTNSNGLVTFSGASSISLNGVFTSTYKNYKVMLNITGSSVVGNASHIRLRSAGSDNSTASYQWIVSNVYFNGIRQLGNSGISTAEVAYTGSGDVSCFTAMDIAAPFETVKTFANISRTYNNENTTGGWWFNGTNSFDGFSIIAGSGNITGTMNVFGYTN